MVCRSAASTHSIWPERTTTTPSVSASQPLAGRAGSRASLSRSTALKVAPQQQARGVRAVPPTVSRTASPNHLLSFARPRPRPPARAGSGTAQAHRRYRAQDPGRRPWRPARSLRRRSRVVLARPRPPCPPRRAQVLAVPTTPRQGSETFPRKASRSPGSRREVILAVMPTLAVVGARPKGIAIAAKARALADAGLMPRGWCSRAERGGRELDRAAGVHQRPAAPRHPRGEGRRLPVRRKLGPASAAVTAAMADYSWQRHLIAHGAYADWVDRGRLRPTHRQWSRYLREVAQRARAEIVTGE